MPKPQIGKIVSVIKDPMVSDHFVMEFPNVPTGSQDEEPLMIQCQNATKPGMTLNEVQVALFGHVLVYAGNLTFSHDMSVTFVENVRGGIMRTLEKWQQLIRGVNTQHGRFKASGDGGGYARDAFLTIFDNKGEAALKYQIKNIWPGTLPDTSFDGSSSSLISHGVSFKYDWYKVVGGYAANMSAEENWT